MEGSREASSVAFAYCWEGKPAWAWQLEVWWGQSHISGARTEDPHPAQDDWTSPRGPRGWGACLSTGGKGHRRSNGPTITDDITPAHTPGTSQQDAPKALHPGKGRGEGQNEIEIYFWIYWKITGLKREKHAVGEIWLSAAGQLEAKTQKLKWVMKRILFLHACDWDIHACHTFIKSGLSWLGNPRQLPRCAGNETQAGGHQTPVSPSLLASPS